MKINYKKVLKSFLSKFKTIHDKKIFGVFYKSYKNIQKCFLCCIVFGMWYVRFYLCYYYYYYYYNYYHYLN